MSYYLGCLLRLAMLNNLNVQNSQAHLPFNINLTYQFRMMKNSAKG